MEDEIVDLIELIDEVYRTFGFDSFMVELSTRPPKSIGKPDDWERAENALKNALRKKQIDFQLNPGEGAFYGPKIDYHIRDSLGRFWQCGTIQVDFSMPERFDLAYIGPDGEKHRPVMIHRAILGSVERFIGILIEHYGGAFPLWLSPVQVRVVPISEKHHDYGKQVTVALKDAGLRAFMDARNEKVGYKIRDAEKKKIPYMLILGDTELQNGTVSVRKHHTGDQGEQSLSGFIEKTQDEIYRRICH